MLYEILNKKLTKTERIDLIIDYFSRYIVYNVLVYSLIFIGVMSYMYYSISFVMTKIIISNILYVTLGMCAFTWWVVEYLDYKEKKEKAQKTEGESERQD